MRLSVERSGELMAATPGGVGLQAVATLTPGVTTCTNSSTSTCATTVAAQH
jgi:hypothetical protein